MPSAAVPNLPIGDDVLGVIRDRGVAEVLRELQVRMPEVFAAIARQLHIGEVLAQSGSIADITIDKVTLGAADVGTLRMNNTNAAVRAGSAILEGVSIALELQLKADWWYDIWIHSDSGTWDLGSMWFGLDIGTVTIPSLSNIQLNIPTLTLNNVHAQMAPIQGLHLGAGSFTGLKVSNTLLPSAGFSIEGMTLGKVLLDTASLPAANSAQARIDHFQPALPVTLPKASLTGLSIPPTVVPNILSGAMDVPAQAPEKKVTVDAKVIGISFRVRPVAHMHVKDMQMSNLTMSIGVDAVSIENVRIPVDINGISLTTLALQNVAANQIDT